MLKRQHTRDGQTLSVRRLSRVRLNEIILVLLLLVCYTYFLPRWADPNQNSRLDMVVAVVEDGTFQIDAYVENTVDYPLC